MSGTHPKDYQLLALGRSQLAYRDEGRRDGFPIMFGNSICCTSGMWDEQVGELERHHRLIRYDYRGHGGSPADVSACSIESLAGEAIGLLDHLGVREFGYVGSSLGGTIGIALTTFAPGRLRALVLANTAAHMPPQERWNKRIEDVVNEGMPRQAVATLNRWFPDAFKLRQPKVVARLLAAGIWIDGPSYISLCRAIRDVDLRQALPKIGCPTLVVGSSEDVSPVSASQALAGAIAGAELQIMEGSGHLPGVDSPAAFTAVLREFLDRQVA